MLTIMKRSLYKYAKYKVLLGSRTAAAALPKTRPLSNEAFWSLMGEYGAVIVKPSDGWGGSRVMQVVSLGKGTYEAHYGKVRKRFGGKAAVFSFVRAQTRRGSFIVQRKIQLAKVKGRPFDLRVMVQRRGTEWVVTGKLAKIAGAGFIITNTARSGGRVVPVSAALRSFGFTAAQVKSIETDIHRISVAAVKQLHKYYRFIRTVGLDIGIDHRGKVWIIEANFSPAKSLFLRLKDKSMYRRIISFSGVRLRKRRRK